jgi:serine protease Do
LRSSYPQFRRDRPQWCGLFLALILALGGLAVPALEVAAQETATEPLRPTVEISAEPAPGTEVPVATELVSLLERGGTPTNIDQLRMLEEQQKRVAQAAVSCAVSVQIGPAQGGGVIVTDTGYVLTAAHVAMRPGKKAMVTLSNGRRVRATTLGMNRSVDAGLIKIDEGQNDGQPFPHASLGDSGSLVPGMWCIATGHPGGYDPRRGPVTRIGRILAVSDTAIVTDCALVGGDSGGPLFDLSGKLIAVHSRIGNDVADNLHVPIDHYDVSWDRMQAGEAWGFLPGFRPVIGVRGDSKLAYAEVSSVAPGSAAEKAGIELGDIIVEFGDDQVTDFESLRDAVAQTMPGERVRVWVNRGGERIRLMLEVGRALEN